MEYFSTVRLGVFNTLGELVQTQSASVAAGENTIRLEFKWLASRCVHRSPDRWKVGRKRKVDKTVMQFLPVVKHSPVGKGLGV